MIHAESGLTSVWGKGELRFGRGLGQIVSRHLQSTESRCQSAKDFYIFPEGLPKAGKHLQMQSCRAVWIEALDNWQRVVSICDGASAICNRASDTCNIVPAGRNNCVLTSKCLRRL
jgi:hypothetical protein